jgi:hypothetical protein
LICDQIRECNQWVEHTSSQPVPESEFLGIVNSFRSMQIKSYINWLEELKNKEQGFKFRIARGLDDYRKAKFRKRRS